MNCEWNLPLSSVAIHRIWRQHDLVHPRQRKHQRQQDLAALKRTWALFQQTSAHTKDLDDIPHYWPQMKARGLPGVQYTAREVRSGLQFLAYASRRSAAGSVLFAQRIQTHLQRCGVNLKDVTWQTDNGGKKMQEMTKTKMGAGKWSIARQQICPSSLGKPAGCTLLYRWPDLKQRRCAWTICWWGGGWPTPWAWRGR
ncbi:MAG TPA: hypothetical protein VG028_18125 [Terriglobia bacterium]|nr:hypothetical protein [Terriglobia bacterium]